MKRSTLIKEINFFVFVFVYTLINLLIISVIRELPLSYYYTSALRDFTVILTVFYPTLRVILELIKYFNRYTIFRHIFILRILRDIVIAIVMGLFLLILVGIIKVLIFSSDNWDINIQKLTAAFLINVICVISIEYYFYFVRYKSIQIQKQKEQYAILMYQQKILKEQINPHFLFNTLNVLSSLIYINQDKANRFTKELSKLYRYILTNSNRDKVELSKEIAFLESYLYIIDLRFTDNLIINVINTDRYNNGYVVPFTLQLLLENAIKHNSFSNENPLNISVIIYDTYIEVKNDIRAKRDYSDSGNVGQRYINTLYKQFGLDVVIDDSTDEYIVKIPVIR
ncbi:MAG: histidine kinase [Bacteroidales bacterium]|nr:histidine kinase [Bacteroidales bacterium]